jgi:hypothetical protein
MHAARRQHQRQRQRHFLKSSIVLNHPYIKKIKKRKENEQNAARDHRPSHLAQPKLFPFGRPADLW